MIICRRFYSFAVLVILAPYSINGTLIGPINREIDMQALMDNWEKNYPVRHLEGLPEFVEVTTGKTTNRE